MFGQQIVTRVNEIYLFTYFFFNFFLDNLLEITNKLIYQTPKIAKQIQLISINIQNYYYCNNVSERLKCRVKKQCGKIKLEKKIMLCY